MPEEKPKKPGLWQKIKGSFKTLEHDVEGKPKTKDAKKAEKAAATPVKSADRIQKTVDSSEKTPATKEQAVTPEKTAEPKTEKPVAEKTSTPTSDAELVGTTQIDMAKVKSQKPKVESEKPVVQPQATVPTAQKPAPEKKVEPEKSDKQLTKEEQQKQKEAQKIYEEGLSSIKDLIAPSSMKIAYDHIQISEWHAQSFVVFGYPRYLETSWLSPVINFDVTMDISMFIYPIDSNKIMKTLRSKVAQMQSSIRIEQEKGRVRDPGIEHALQDAEELRDKIQQGIEKFFQFGIYFTIYSKDKSQLTHLSKQLETLLGGKLVVTKSIQARCEQAINSTLPYGTDELFIVRNMNTEPLSSSFPFTSSELTSDKGILYGLNRHNNSLVIFDRFSLPNANSVVLATSGAGKSYAVKLEIFRSLMLGTDVIVIDPENEYEALAQTIGGTYLRVSLSSDKRINPFDLPLSIEGYEEAPGDLLRNSIINLEGLIKIMLGDITHEDEAIIEQSLVDTYALKGINFETESPGEIPPPTMEDFYEVLNNTKGGESIARRIKQYTTGIYSGIFNKPTNIDLGNGLVVFCIRDLEEILRPTAIYIILNYIWNRVRSQLKKRLLVMDEAWTLLQHEDSANFVYGLVKRARKYYLGVTTITQNVEDLLSTDRGKAIITNSAMQLLLKQASSAMPTLSDVFKLTEGEQYFVQNAAQGEGIFFADRRHVAIQVIASYNENQVMTTNPEEILAQKEAKEGFEAK